MLIIHNVYQTIFETSLYGRSDELITRYCLGKEAASPPLSPNFSLQ